MQNQIGGIGQNLPPTGTVLSDQGIYVSLICIGKHLFQEYENIGTFYDKGDQPFIEQVRQTACKTIVLRDLRERIFGEGYLSHYCVIARWNSAHLQMNIVWTRRRTSTGGIISR